MENQYDVLNKKIPPEGKKDEQIAALQGQLSAEKEARREERFCWTLSLIVLLDVFFFEKVGGWGAISILFLQIVLLVILSRKWGIEDLTDILDKYVRNHPLNPTSKKKSKTSQ